MKKLLLVLAMLAPTLVSAQSWSSAGTVTVPYSVSPSSGIHGLAVDGQNRLWVQHYYATEPITRNGTNLNTRALYVLNADGSSAACSPILYINNAAGTRIDTLGVYTTSLGKLDTRTGRGLESDVDGNILVSQFDNLYLLNSSSCASASANSIRQIAKVTPVPGVSITGAGVDDAGNAYVSQVGGGNPIFQYGPGLTPGQNVAPTHVGFARKLVASRDGRFVFETSYSTPGVVTFYRPDEFSAFDSLGVTLRGLRVESATQQPGTNLLWFSSGPTASGGANEDPAVATFYKNNAWYAFTIEDLIRFDGTGVATGTVEHPATPRDSIVVTEFKDAAGLDLAGPRGLAFSKDGKTAYLTNFGVSTATAVVKYTKNPTSITGGVEPTGFSLGQNQPNPFSTQTEIALTLPEADHVRMRVFDTMGRVVATLVDGQMTAGNHRLAFDASDLAAGVYVYTVEVNGYGTSRRMAIVR